MTLNQVLADLQLDVDRELLAPYWDEDVACLPQSPDLLQPETFLALREYVSLDAAVDPLLEQVAAEIRSSEPLKALWWHCTRLVFHHLDYPGPNMRQWPVLDRILGDAHGVFYLLASLEAVPLMKQEHQALGVPDEVTRGVNGNYEELTKMYRAIHPGLWGADLRVLYWLRNASTGILFRLGRMEYMNKPLAGQVRAFRHRNSGEVLALAEDGMSFTEEGYAGAGWTASLQVTAEMARGNLIHPAGHALREVVELPLSEWECVLKQGDHVLETHIPGGGNFLPELCRDSMQQAVEFFARFFPEQPFVGIGCRSWILNPRWHEVYRPENNMTAWQREMYLYPIPCGGRDGLFFLFGRDDIDPSTAPRDTSMRRAVLDWLASGKRLMSGGAFMLTEHLEGYGSQFYRREARFR